MRVKLFNDGTTKTGVSKATVLLPDNSEAEYYALKQAIKQGKDIALIVVDEAEVDEGDPLIALILGSIQKARQEEYEKGRADELAEWQKKGESEENG